MTPVRVAVVGAGRMGANHARVYSTLKGVELVAVVDSDLDRARSVADLHDTAALGSLSDLAGLADAVSVAVPSSLHLEVGLQLFGLGLDCLIEKPLAGDPDEGMQLVQAARDADRVLLVGHIERFNPAVEQLAEILRGGPEIIALDARRMSAVSSRITDVDVVSDLMIHDLEIVMDLVDSEVIDVVARSGSGGGRSGDYVTALLSFASGALASVTASRVTQNQVRELHVTTPERFLTVDYQAQELRIYRQGRIAELGGTIADGRYTLDVGTERVFVRRSEPLAAELAHFVAAVRREVEPRVSGADAVKVLEVAAVIRQMAGGRP